MNAIVMPRQTGRSFQLYMRAIRSAALNGASVIVVPTQARVYDVRDTIMGMDKENGKNVIVVSFDEYISGRLHPTRWGAPGNCRAFIDDDDLDAVLSYRSGVPRSLTVMEYKTEDET